MEALVFIGAIAIIAVFYFVAKEFAAIAEMKGFPERKYFWWSFLVPAFGTLMVVALPNRAGKETAAPAVDDQLPEL